TMAKVSTAANAFMAPHLPLSVPSASRSGDWASYSARNAASSSESASRMALSSLLIAISFHKGPQRLSRRGQTRLHRSGRDAGDGGDLCNAHVLTVEEGDGDPLLPRQTSK